MDRSDENIDVQVSGGKQWIKTLFTSPLLIYKIIRMTVLGLLLLLSVFILPTVLQKIIIPVVTYHPVHISVKDSVEMKTEIAALEKSIKKLDKTLSDYIPSSYYMIINSTDNVFYLKKGTKVIREGRCSTGSYLLLENDKQQKWLFRTPKGQLKVLNKKTDPVWKKPDWAFIEDGLPVPSANHPSRFEYGVLGDYALSLGNGYMIHGTLWQRYLGLPVTHGCVRLNDADLEVVYKTLSVGSKVYIF